MNGAKVEKKALKLGYMPLSDCLPLLVAQEKGFFAQEGLEVEWDAARNLIIRLPGENPELASVATGSHLDSVPEGGNYDGAAGVIAGLAVLIASKDEGARQRSMEVIALRGEESA